MSPPCRHFEVCHLPATQAHGGDEYCYLHWPQREGKNLEVFNKLLREVLKPENSDFRFIQFPAGLGSPNDFAGRRFVGPADFSDVGFHGSLNLRGAVFEQGLRITGQHMGPILLDGAKINSGSLYLQVAADVNLSLQGAVIRGEADLNSGSSLSLHAGGTEVHGLLSIASAATSGLYLHGASLHGGFKLRVTACDLSRDFSWVLVKGDLDWRNCKFRGEVRFDGASFDPDAQLDLTQSWMDGLRISGHRLLPKVIALSAARIAGDLRLEADLGEPRLKLLANTDLPKVDGEATFTNVDLSECLLVGNVFQRMTFSNVEWHRYQERWVLYDEIVALPRKTTDGGVERVRPIPVTNIREAYQILKERYREAGDHVRSGDFHYGEMEMKRREYGSVWRRFVGPEALYGYLSGYGTRWGKAMWWLAGIVLGSAAIYYWLDPWAFSWNYGVALKYSLEVATFQRPELPKHVSRWSHWVRGVETVWGPVQIALFGLALRMRLRR